MLRIMTVSAVVVAGLLAMSSVNAASDKPWLQPGWEPITEQERQPPTESEIGQVQLSEKTANGVRYLSGGFGVAERAWLAEQGADYPLRVEFSRGARGEFVSQVTLVLTNAAGEQVFKAVSDGPLMYLDLPPGRYQGSASYAGQAREFAVNVSGTAQVRANVNFP